MILEIILSCLLACLTKDYRFINLNHTKRQLSVKMTSEEFDINDLISEQNKCPREDGDVTIAHFVKHMRPSLSLGILIAESTVSRGGDVGDVKK